ncbi:MAG: hypothetical protein J6J97_05120 [Akkermansia sp.]|nr:hypothetical protein [Akkermansia sp.]
MHFVPLLSWRQLHNIITNSVSHPKAVKQRGGSGAFWPGLPHFGCKFAEIPQQLVKFLILIAFFSIFFGLLNCTSHGKCDRLWVIRTFARIVPGWVGASVRKRAARPTAIRETKPPRKKRLRPYHLLLHHRKNLSSPTAPNMKLHLPKQLFTALLAAITLATPATLTLGSSVGAADELGIVREGNFWANDYTYSFMLQDDAFTNVIADANGAKAIVLSRYYGSGETNNLGSNALIAVQDSAGAITLKLGRGQYTSASDSFSLDSDNCVSFDSDVTVKTGVVYTLKVTGATGSMTPTLYGIATGESDTQGSYNGNMNDNADPMNSVFNDNDAILISGSSFVASDDSSTSNVVEGTASLVENNTLVWAGTPAEGAAAWTAESTTWNNISGSANGVAAGAANDVIFDASSATAKTVTLGGSLAVNSISVYGDYTFNATAATTLSTTSGLTIASGKILTLNSTATEVNTINGGISGGTLKIDSGSWSISGGLSSTLDLADAATLNLGDGSFISHAAGDFKTINDKTNITTSGTGYIKLTTTSSSEVNLESDWVASKSYSVAGNLTINGVGWAYDGPAGRTLTLEEGKNFAVGGALSIVSRAIIDIAGGSMTAGTIKLGHPTESVKSDNSTREYWGKLAMSSGSLKTGTITFQTTKQNQISITGGSLEFTDAAAINRGSNTASTVNIMGSSADSRVTLKAHTAWTLDGAGLTALPTIGNVTIDAANTAGIKLDNVALSGSIVNNADLTLGAGVTVASGTAATLSGSNAIKFADTITQSGTLIISSNVAAVGPVTDFDLKKEGTGGYVLDAGNLTATNENQNGFIFTGGAEYWLVKGGENTLTGNLTLTDNSGNAFNLATSTTESDTGIYISTGDNYVETSRYYITTGDVTVIGTGAENATGAGTYVLQGGTMQLAGGTVKSSEILYTSGAINLASGSSLLLDSSDNAASYITTTTTGAGNIEIGTTVTLDKGSSTQENFAGSLVVNRGGELILVRKSGGSAAADETVSLADVTLNGGQLSFTGGNTTLDKLTVKAGSADSKFYIFDMLGADGRATTTFTISNLELNAGMQIQSGYKSHLKIDSLSGTGELQLLQRANTDYQVVDINAGTGYTGLLNLDGGASMTVNLNIAQGATTKIKADNASTIEKVVLADGAKLAYDTKHSAYTYTINNVEIVGEATIAMEASATYHEGCLNIGNLVNAEGSENGELTLSSNYRNSTRNIINLNGGDFSGKINYVASSTDSRKHGFNINHGTVAEHAEINISDNNSNTNSIALGIGAERVKVKALSGGNGNVAIYSGQQAYGNSNVFGAVDTTFRTLEIATNSGEYTANMAIKNYLNLEKSGAGSQEITGSMSDFNGTIKVTGGTLTLSGLVGTSAVATAGAVTVTDGLLEFKNTSYVSDVHMSGGNLTYGGSGVTHTVTGTLDTPDGAGTGDTLKVESGTNLVVGTLQNAWGIQTVVDGTLTATNLIISYGQQAGSTSGAGSITTTGMEAKNYGNLRYEISVHELSVGSTGISISDNSNLFLNSDITLVAGATSVESGSSLNIETGSATLKGVLSGAGALRVYGGSLTLEAASEIAQFTYSGGTLNHSGLTVTNATFSGGTLVNTGALTLNGTLNIENQSALTESGTASYSDGDNGFYRGSYYVIKSDGETGTSLTLGEEGFALQLMGTAVSDSSTSGANYWSKDEAGNLLLTIQDNSGTYYVNKNTVTVGGSSATAGVEAASAFHVASGAKLDIAVLPTGWTAAELLAGKVTGAGTLLVSQSMATGNTNLTTTFGGILELAQGVTFTFGNGENYSDGLTINTSTLTGVVLNAGAAEAGGETPVGSTLVYNANGLTTFKNFTVKAQSETEKGTATLHYKDSSNDNAVLLAGTTQLDGNLNVTTLYDGGINVEHLSGAGSFSVTGSSISGNFDVTIQSLQGYSGSLSFSDAELSANVSTGTGATITMGSITASDVRSFTLNVDTSVVIGSLNSPNGTVNLAADTTLTLGQAGEGAQATTSSIGTVNVASGSGSIYLNETATLESFSKTGDGTLRLTGSGEYNLGASHSMPNGVELASGEWTGKVVIDGITSNADIRFDKLGVAGSTVVIGENGVQGYLQRNSAADNNSSAGETTFAANIELEGDMAIKDGYSDSSYVFTGAISGDGNWIIDRTAGGSNTYTFQNIAGWSGTLQQTGTQSTEIILDTSVTEVNAAITRTNGTLDLTVKDNAVFNKEITVSSLTSEKSLTFNVDATVLVDLETGGSIQVQDGTLTIDGNLNASNQTVFLSGTWNDNTSQGSEGKSTAKIQLNGTANTIGTLNFGGGGYFRGSMTLGEDSTTTVSTFYMNKDVRVDMAAGATLKVGENVTMQTAGEEASITIGDSGTTKGQFAATDSDVNYILSGLDVEVSAAGAFNYELNQSSVTNTGTGELKLTNTNNVITNVTAQSGNVVVNGARSIGGIEVAAEKMVSLSNGNMQVESADGVSSATMSGGLVAMQSATSFSISDMVLSNVKLSAVEGASVALNNVSGTAELAGAGNYTLGMVGAMENDNGGTALTLKYTSDLAITMSGTGSQLLLSADPTVDANGIFGTYNLTLTLNYTLAGDLASAETVNWQDLVGFTGILGDLLTAQTPEATVDLAEGEAAVAASGTAPTVEYTYRAPADGAQVGTLVIAINGLNVPEPATSTLSLLALAALCARRRRK